MKGAEKTMPTTTTSDSEQPQTKETTPAKNPSQAEALVAGLEDLRMDLRFLKTSTFGKSLSRPKFLTGLVDRELA